MIDMHTHSTASDGSVAPEELPGLAREAGLSALALTDHDTTAGIAAFLDGCSRTSVEGVAGVELSASWYGASLHIVGLFIDPACHRLAALLQRIRRDRNERNRQMVSRLAAAGVSITMADLENEAEGRVIGRPHFASLLLRKGVCRTRREVFEEWIGTNCPCYVRRFLPLPEEAIAAIREAGGRAILGHPFGNPEGTPVAKVRKILRHLVPLGLDGIEAYYSGHTSAETDAAAALADEFSLVLSGGSDFHGERMPGIRLGVGRGALCVPDGLLPHLRPATG
jgi:hypothetical protein